MKKIVRLLFILITLQFSVQFANSCTITETPLRKQFRNANSVFIGKGLKVTEYKPTERELLLLPKSWRDWKIWSKVTFEIEKKWKGRISKTQEFIAVAYYICGCSTTMSQFKEREDYLAFSEGKNFVFICDSEETETETAEKKVKRIDNMGFRFWSRIYPF